MTRTVVIDPALEVRVHGQRVLRYAAAAEAHEDRPAHVRAASGLAMHAGRLVVVQDDASFFGVVGSDGVTAMKLPRGLHGRRRFEIALGNKLDKLDLESVVAIDDELWAFGSGSLPIRDKICRVRHGIPRVLDAAPLFARLREALDNALNIEGAARVLAVGRDELWLFHRGNTGPRDPGPAVLRLATAEMRAWLDATAQMPALVGVDSYDLGTADGARIGFTDAVADGARVFYLAAAERAPNAIDDGPASGSQLGVIDVGSGIVRAASLTHGGAPVKAEGIAFDPARPKHAWIALDPDDPEAPAPLLDVELIGPWW
ncbi:MAG: DUF6929 family protein [Kofleriaceae bacterium]